MLSQQSQLLQRNIDLFDDGEWLLINPADAYFTDLLTHRNLDVLHQYFDVFSESVRVVPNVFLDSRDVVNRANGFEVTQKVGNHQHTFTPFTTGYNQYTDVVVYLPKAKAHLLMLLQMAAGVVKPGGRIHVVGENKGGIKSVAKLMNEYGNTEKVDSARHCSLITTFVEQDFPAFSVTRWLEESTFTLDDTAWQVCSLPGVFSHNELDGGTLLLLEKLSTSMRGKILDFACGAGVIGAYLLSRYPHLDVDFLDVSALSLYCTAHTLAENQQTATLIGGNGLHGLEEKYAHIVTNPPFHTGIKTDYSITKRFILDARNLLVSKGGLHMVANRYLPYPGLLGETFDQVQTLAQNSQFTVYLATTR